MLLTTRQAARQALQALPTLNTTAGHNPTNEDTFLSPLTPYPDSMSSQILDEDHKSENVPPSPSLSLSLPPTNLLSSLLPEIIDNERSHSTPSGSSNQQIEGLPHPYRRTCRSPYPPELDSSMQHGSQARIDALSLEQYLKELASLVLEKNWDLKIRQQVLSSKQGEHEFIDWKIEVENLNRILTTTAPTLALKPDALKNQPEANDFACNTHCTERKTLLSCLSEPNTSHHQQQSASLSPAGSSKCIPRLTDLKRALLDKHDGCTRCCKFYVGHHVVDCPMTANNTWPDHASYIPLMESIARSAKPGTSATAPRIAVAFAHQVAQDEDTESYVTPPEPIVFTVPHLYARLEITGPSVEEFPLSIQALLDISCPSVMISAELVTQLGLRHFNLPPEEDNLLSLSDAPLRCQEAKVHKGLPIPLILGMLFLSAEHIVIDAESCTAIKKHNKHDLYKPPPLTPKKVWPPKPPNIFNAPAPALTGYLLPESLMAAVKERIEVLADQLLMSEKDAEYKVKFADRFPLQLPDTTDIPKHIFHCIRLKDPNKVPKSRGYTAPKKYHDSWKILLDEHLAAGCIQPSSSKYSSPAFCTPKHLEGMIDLMANPQWVNDYQELTQETSHY
ncbi:hypothetical protein M422DRAFT_251569 [Sphaerobolus stellatus SS14]|uniref:Uncharacterized protein n=1 Tax=Sphaerobolus stellatus (strain SS14) TaxID=990650 RepID=A0A0C9UPZ8_SPHS4|nr:hypothetical protein M422DRAFT_251569 [Sphaerobolus stellatus SS14]